MLRRVWVRPLNSASPDALLFKRVIPHVTWSTGLKMTALHHNLVSIPEAPIFLEVPQTVAIFCKLHFWCKSIILYQTLTGVKPLPLLPTQQNGSFFFFYCSVLEELLLCCESFLPAQWTSVWRKEANFQTLGKRWYVISDHQKLFRFSSSDVSTIASVLFVELQVIWLSLLLHFVGEIVGVFNLVLTWTLSFLVLEMVCSDRVPHNFTKQPSPKRGGGRGWEAGYTNDSRIEKWGAEAVWVDT